MAGARDTTERVRLRVNCGWAAAAYGRSTAVASFRASSSWGSSQMRTHTETATKTVLEQATCSLEGGNQVRKFISAALLSAALLTLAGCGTALPDTKQMTVAQATAAIESAGFKVGQVTYDEKSTGTAGSVISQTTQAGGGISLVVAGPPPTAAPLLLGLDKNKAQAVLAGVGLALGPITESYDASAVAGTVASQTPAPGAGTPKGSAVAIVMSKGLQPIAVPSVLGKTKADAQTLLEAAGVKVKTTYKNDKAERGTVVAQKPAGGQAQPGTTVTISVSTGLDLVKVPSWRNFHATYKGDDFGRAMDSLQASIEAGFRRAGVVAVVEFGPGPDWKEYQHPKAGSMVRRGTRVDIHIPVWD